MFRMALERGVMQARPSVREREPLPRGAVALVVYPASYPAGYPSHRVPEAPAMGGIDREPTRWTRKTPPHLS